MLILPSNIHISLARGKGESVEPDDTLIFLVEHVFKNVSGRRHAAVLALVGYIVA